MSTSHREPTVPEKTNPPGDSPAEGGNAAVRYLQRRFRCWAGRLLSAGILLGTGLALIAALGAAQRLGWIQSGTGSSTPSGSAAGGNGVVYVCPMMCTSTRQTTPGRCPVCGMDLAPVKSSGGGDGPQMSVTIEPAARRIANIQTSPVEWKYVERTIRSVGKIAFDESRQATIAAYVDGRIEKLYVDYTGTDVSSGQHMALLYSPELYAAQVEYLVSRRSEQKVKTVSASSLLGGTKMNLTGSAREKLIELGMTPEQIAELEKRDRAETRLKICAPIGGTVIEKLKQEGEYVKTGEPIYRIADLGLVWLLLDLFPEDAARVRYGQKVEAEVQSLPGEVFVGRVAFIDPFVNEKTRTVRVRVEILNFDRRLRPGDYATARIRLPVARNGVLFDPELAGKWISPRHPQVLCNEPGCCPLSGQELVSTEQFGYAKEADDNGRVLVVPRTALLMAGGHSIVYVETEPGKFEIRRVTLGPLTEHEAVVFKGVQRGERVVTSGNFLIDSQMQLAGNPSIIDPDRIRKTKKTEPSPGSSSGPLELQIVELKRYPGKTGQHLDNLFRAYFSIRKSLARDKPPETPSLQKLEEAAGKLQTAEIPADLKTQLKIVSGHLSTLKSGELDAVRKAFRPVSHAVLQLAARARGPKTAGSFIHFYCPMVPGGGGDWLQAEDTLLNPYFGSQMLKCGRQVRLLGMAKTATAANPSSAKQSKRQ